MILDRNTVLLEGKITRTSRFGKVSEEENQLAKLSRTCDIQSFLDQVLGMLLRLDNLIGMMSFPQNIDRIYQMAAIFGSKHRHYRSLARGFA